MMKEDIERLEEEFETSRCGRCGKYLGDDRYCRVCGTKRGIGKYEPDMECMECIYGPEPIDRTHKCKKCGNKYTVALMVDNERYCPRCGGETVIISQENMWL